MFQSLIGRLKTDQWYVALAVPVIQEFQSLIGRLKTNLFIYYPKKSPLGFNPL